MPPQEKDGYFEVTSSQKLTNKTFYRFVFSFIAVIAGVLFLVLALGVGGGVQ